MQILNTSNPLLSAASPSGNNVVEMLNNSQGTVVPVPTLVGSTGITAFNPTRANLDVINPVYPTFTFSGTAAGATLSVNGVVYTAVASAATGYQFNIGATDAVTAANFLAVFNSLQAVEPGAWFTEPAAKIIVQFTLDGTGTVSATAQLEVSLDGVNAFVHPGLAAQSLSGTNHAQFISAELDVYPFIRVNVTALSGTGAKVIATLSNPLFN